MSIEDEAAKYMRDKRVDTKRVLPSDRAANALTSIRDELRDFLTGNKPLHPESLLQLCNMGLA